MLWSILHIAIESELLTKDIVPSRARNDYLQLGALWPSNEIRLPCVTVSTFLYIINFYTWPFATYSEIPHVVHMLQVSQAKVTLSGDVPLSDCSGEAWQT